VADPTRTRTIRVEMTIGLDDRDGRAVISTRDGELGSMPREDFLAMVAREFGVSILFPAAAEPPEPDQAESVPEPTPDPARTATGDSDPRPVRQCRRTEAHDPHSFLTTRGVVQWCRCAGVATPPEPDRYVAMVLALVAKHGRPGATATWNLMRARQWLDAAGVPALLAELAEMEQAKARSFVATVGKLVAIRKALDGALTADDDESTTDLAERVARVLRVRTAVIETLRTKNQRVETERAQAVAERDEARIQMGRLASGAARIDADSVRLRTERDDALAALAGVTPENYHTELRHRRNDDMEVRGILSPNGGTPAVPMELGPTVAPAVAWLVSDRDRLAGELNTALERIRQLIAQNNVFRRAPRPDGWLAISTPITLDNTDGRYEPTEPRTWATGDPEPGPEVTRVRDRDGDLWKRRKRKGGWRSYTMGVCQWHDGPIGWAPLTDATSEVAG
jgi:hypothetical protein